MKRSATAWALSILVATLDAGCTAAGDAHSSVSKRPPIAGARRAATTEPAEDISRYSDQQLADRITEQWSKLRGLTNQSVDHALRFEGSNLEQDARYRRMQADIVENELLLTQLQDEQRRRTARPR